MEAGKRVFSLHQSLIHLEQLEGGLLFLHLLPITVRNIYSMISMFSLVLIIPA